MLIQLGHPQPSIPIKTDNETANNFIHNNVAQKLSKSWDMRYYWLRDQHNQNSLSSIGINLKAIMDIIGQSISLQYITDSLGLEVLNEAVQIAIYKSKGVTCQRGVYRKSR